MLATRKKDERGVANFGWLNSHHTFSFGEYHDQRYMGFGPLRVINEDRVAAARGYEQKAFSDAEKTNRLRLVGSGDGREGSITIHRDAGLSIQDTEILNLRAITTAELLVFDMER